MKHTKFFKALFAGCSVAGIMVAALMFLPQEAQAATTTIICQADGTDENDDTRAIQDCLNQAQNNESTIIKIPAGTYYISRTLVIYSNTTLQLDENAVIVRTDEEHIMIRTEQDETVGGYGQVENVVIEGGTWDGNVEDTTVLCPLMYFCHGKNIALKDFSIKSACSRHMIIIAGVDTALVDGVSFSEFVLYTGDETNSDYYGVEGADGEIDIELGFRTMEALHLDCISADGMSESQAFPCDNTVNKSITVQNCVFDGVMSGVGSHYMADPNVKGSDLVIKNNTFKNVKYTCIDIYNQTNATVYSNVATNSGEIVRLVNSTATIKKNAITCRADASESTVGLCGIKATTSTYLVLDSNVINGGTHGISLSGVVCSAKNNIVKNAKGNGLTALDKSNVSITNNTITNSAANGIYLSTGKATINKNTITTTGNHGIAAYYMTATITNNAVTGTKYHGICVNSAISTVKLNAIKNASGHGIYVLNKSKATVTENAINGAKVNAIYYNASFGDVTSNKITAPGGMGILIYGVTNTSSATRTNVTGNIIASPVENAIRVEGSSYVNVSSNVASSAGKHTINVYDSSVVSISSNTLGTNKADGIFVYKVKTVVIKGNNIKTTANRAVAVYSATGASVLSNTITTATLGVLINDVTGSVNSNVINNTTERAIWVLENSDVDIKQNKIINAKALGIHVNDSDAYVYLNKIVTPLDKGVYFYNSTGKIQSNTITDAGTNAVKVDTSEVVSVVTNTIKNAKGQSINIYNSSTVYMASNILQGNNAEPIYVYAVNNITIKNNSIDTTPKNAIAVYKSTKVNVTDNTVGTALNGVLMNDSQGGVQNNSFTSLTERGIWAIEGSNAVVYNNTITAAGTHGIHFTSSTGKIKANIIKKAGAKGIYLYSCTGSNSGMLEVSQNNVANTTGVGIQAEKSNAYVYKNTITTPVDKGIYFNGSTGKIQLNTITDPGSNGIKADASNKLYVITNTIKNAKGQSINIYGSSVVYMADNILQGNKAEPIYVYEVTSITIKNNKIDSTSKNAIAVYKSTGINVDNNTVGTALNGVLANASQGTVQNNIFTSLSERGIWVLEGSDVIVSNNTITAAGKHGIHFATSKGKIKGNNIKKAGEKGIYIYSCNGTAATPVEVSSNVVTNTTDRGVQVEGSSYLNIIGNTVTACSMQGIRCISNCSNITITNNKVTDNGQHGIMIDNCTSVKINNNMATNNKTKDITVISGTGSAKENIVSTIGTYTYDDTKFSITKSNGFYSVAGGWYYLKNGMIDTSFTGIAENTSGKWYVKNGVLDPTYNGTVKINGVSYQIVNGKVS